MGRRGGGDLEGGENSWAVDFGVLSVPGSLGTALSLLSPWPQAYSGACSLCQFVLKGGALQTHFFS